MKSYSRYSKSNKSRKTRRICPSGYRYRKPYVRSFKNTVRQKGYTVRKKTGVTYRIYPKVNHIDVKGQCVKRRSFMGKEKEIFGKLSRGELIKHGYSYHLSDEFRHNALKRAINEYNASKVFYKLDTIAKISKNVSHKAYSIFIKDRNWVKNNYLT
jgi:predicted RNA-binding protein